MGFEPGIPRFESRLICIPVVRLPDLSEAQFLHLLKGITYALQSGHEDYIIYAKYTVQFEVQSSVINGTIKNLSSGPILLSYSEQGASRGWGNLERMFCERGSFQLI